MHCTHPATTDAIKARLYLHNVFSKRLEVEGCDPEEASRIAYETVTGLSRRGLQTTYREVRDALKGTEMAEA